MEGRERRETERDRESSLPGYQCSKTWGIQNLRTAAQSLGWLLPAPRLRGAGLGLGDQTRGPDWGPGGAGIWAGRCGRAHTSV